MKKIQALKLGGTLFVPALMKDIDSIISGKKYPSLKSIVIDTEDSINDDDIEKALESLRNTLVKLKKSSLLVFIRPRNISVLEEILQYKNIDKIQGFILPKFSLKNADNYLFLLQKTEYMIMPSIEGKELFEQSKLIKLRKKILPLKEQVILIRFGLEDMLRQLKMRRECDESIFDMSVGSNVLGNFLAVFKGSSFDVSGGVYPCFKNKNGFIKDVKRDLKEGLISKTIIHPNQIQPFNEFYKVTQTQFDEATSIVESKKAVFTRNGKMLETTTMQEHSKVILQRAKLYGVQNEC